MKGKPINNYLKISRRTDPMSQELLAYMNPQLLYQAIWVEAEQKYVLTSYTEDVLDRSKLERRTGI